MNIESKTSKLITKLMRETINGNVSWQVMEPPSALDEATERVIPIYLQAKYKNTFVGIYEVRSKSFYDEHSFYWTESIDFCIVNEEGKVIWEANEYSPALLDLFNTAREQASGIDDLLDDLLED